VKFEGRGTIEDRFLGLQETCRRYGEAGRVARCRERVEKMKGGTGFFDDRVGARVVRY
jgi:hypothetical protein